MHKIFVYGTLKKGNRNHFLLRGKQPLLAIAPNIDLHVGPHYPFAIHGSNQVHGEVYEVNDILLQQLDLLEGHPDNYCRELIPVILANGAMIKAWIYLHPAARRYPLQKDGQW